ncbi:putative metal-dependent phosphoesterase TrpH [Natronocella acetinitrilica]|uniref:Metal-dependent phosphoesterase TrpH n=1 Tax=Natronocella acetinitrilica TaxID=414046 RepID=A0AAE3G489_9GAMM|nr:PHP domain-containing protein [Natronocella acetinitrilica]MCP1675520.1 putative metal-dependent phosphoesterase TrpH [Natronocella acetinitrilica]
MSVASSIDLHAHSTASDGRLPPAELVERAAGAGVRVLALTDHDTLSGLPEALTAAGPLGMQLVAGVEISTLWERREIHVVGLGVDPADARLTDGLDWNQQLRRQRFAQMVERLEQKGGITGLGGVMEEEVAGQPGRLHLARHLVEHGWARTVQQAFDRYLRRGRAGYVRAEWMSLESAVSLIRAAGGIAVLAHPLAYKLTGAWMQRLLTAFTQAGGQGLEVVVGTADRRRVDQSLGYALRHGLLGSVGSDFHGPNPAGIEPGRLLPLPAAVAPVWAELSDCHGRPVSAAVDPGR